MKIIETLKINKSTLMKIIKFHKSINHNLLLISILIMIIVKL